MDANTLAQTMDARVWAATFMDLSARHGPFDEDTMLTWFANAILCGWDHHARDVERDEEGAAG